MSEGNGQLVSIFARWRNLQDQKASISEDSKELFAEAKSNGFEPKALRLAFAAAVRADEPLSDADLAVRNQADIYLAILHAPLDAHAYVREALGTHPATRAGAQEG